MYKRQVIDCSKGEKLERWGEYLMETKVIKPLLRSLFLSYVLSALFLGVLAFAPVSYTHLKR